MTPQIRHFAPVGFAVAVAVGIQIADAAEQRQYETSTVVRAVKTHPSQGEVRPVEGAEARLVRTPGGFFVQMATRELEPGNAYTLWLVAINAPEKCKTAPCKGPDVVSRTKLVRAEVGYGDGMIAGPDGSAQFAAFQRLGEFREAWYGFGLEQPGAEIHLVLNDHGPLKPGAEHEMLTTYRAGCSDDSIPKAFPDTARADGNAGSNQCRLVQLAVFEPVRR